MSNVNVQRVSSTEEKKLPIFDELKEVTDRIRVRAFNLFANRGFGAGGDMDDWLTAEREICWPAAELSEEDDEFEVKVALAGFEARDITVTATPDELIIKASCEDKREGKDEDHGNRIRWTEFRGNEVYRQIPLPAPVDVARIEAKFEKGMLEIEAPKLKREKKGAGKRKIKIS